MALMRCRRLLLGLTLAWTPHSQSYTRQNIAAIFGFENNNQAGVLPAGWSGNTGQQFDYGSGIVLTTLSDTQIANLATLAKVWGFLKYHHPAVTSGQHHWDYDLFRAMPQVLAAPDQATALAAISTWIDSLGPVAPCSLGAGQ